MCKGLRDEFGRSSGPHREGSPGSVVLGGADQQLLAAARKYGSALE